MISTAIQIENLSKTYNLEAINIKTFKEFINSKISGMNAPGERERIRTVNALTDISIEVLKGESLGIIGKNGSGKSTLLKILSGMYVRLAFSVVAHLSADILLFDEVMAVGDMQFQIKSYNKIQSLLQGGTTVLLVSHNLNDVQKFCSRALVLENGRISKYGPTEEIISNYAEKEITESRQEEPASDDKPRETVRQEVVWEDILKAPGDEVIVQIDYWKIKDEDVIDIGIIVSHFNNILFASSNRLSKSLENRVIKEKGLYSTKAIIPANFLNSTVYSLDVYGFLNLTDVILSQSNIIFFKVNDVIDEVIGALYKKMPTFPGSIRPQLDWKVEK